jgi:hypothetical protein
MESDYKVYISSCISQQGLRKKTNTENNTNRNKYASEWEYSNCRDILSSDENCLHNSTSSSIMEYCNSLYLIYIQRSHVDKMYKCRQWKITYCCYSTIIFCMLNQWPSRYVGLNRLDNSYYWLKKVYRKFLSLNCSKNKGYGSQYSNITLTTL